MDTIKITPHRTTSNVYVQRQITRDNIHRFLNYMNTREYAALPSGKKREVITSFKALKSLKHSLDSKIDFIEQTSFAFGGIITSR